MKKLGSLQHLERPTLFLRIDAPDAIITGWMNTYVALLRAVNVGGTGKLPMTDLKALCSELGFLSVKTYIASGNVVFQSTLSEAKVKAALEKCLAQYTGKPATVFVRTGVELDALVSRNPFPEASSSRVMALFTDAPVPKDVAKSAKGLAHEEMVPAKRALYIHYPTGAGTSKLRLPLFDVGTARNMNTVAKLAEMARALEA